MLCLLPLCLLLSPLRKSLTSGSEIRALLTLCLSNISWTLHLLLPLLIHQSSWCGMPLQRTTLTRVSSPKLTYTVSLQVLTIQRKGIFKPSWMIFHKESWAGCCWCQYNWWWLLELYYPIPTSLASHFCLKSTHCCSSCWPWCWTWNSNHLYMWWVGLVPYKWEK